MIRHSWRTQLKAAVREKEVLAVVRGFLAEWSQLEIAELPPRAWPERISDRAQLMAHAVLLSELHARFEGDAAQLRGLQELLLFFTHAAVRIAKIGSAAEADPPRRTRSTAARKRTANGKRAGSARRR